MLKRKTKSNLNLVSQVSFFHGIILEIFFTYSHSHIILHYGSIVLCMRSLKEKENLWFDFSKICISTSIMKFEMTMFVIIYYSLDEVIHYPIQWPRLFVSWKCPLELGHMPQQFLQKHHSNLQGRDRGRKCPKSYAYEWLWTNNLNPCAPITIVDTLHATWSPQKKKNRNKKTKKKTSEGIVWDMCTHGKSV